MIDRDPRLAFHTVSGRSVWPTDPRPGDEFLITDIGHGLSNIGRFNGQAPGFYSVAQHCVLVSRLLPPAFRLWGLMHDAHETYLGDWSRPLIAALPKLRILEDRLLEPIVRSFGLEWPMPALVQEADDWALALEEFYFHRPGAARTLDDLRRPDPWPDLAKVSLDLDQFHRPQFAKHLFLTRFEFLVSERDRGVLS